MNISGPLPVNPPQPPENIGLALRVNERIAAEVLHVAGDQVQLAMEGTRFVARLTSPDQAAALAGRRMAQFIVRDTSGAAVALQLLPPASSQAGAQILLEAGRPDLAAALLRSLSGNLAAGAPLDQGTLWIARALLGRGLPVTPELIAEFHTALAQAPGWGEGEAQHAAALKSLGLPVTPGSLALAGESFPTLDALLGDLRGQAQALLQQNRSGPLAELLREALKNLEALCVDWSDEAGLAEKLKLAIGLAGRSLEHTLAESLQGREENGRSGLPEQTFLRTLAALQRELAQVAPGNTGGRELAGTVERFLDGLRRMQLANVTPEAPPERGQWLSLDVPLGAPQPAYVPPGQPSHPSALARLRVAVLAEGGARAIDPANTRLLIQVDLEEGESITVDLSIVNRRIGARLLASNEALRQAAEAELPSLKENLAGQGYQLLNARVETGRPSPLPGLDVPAPRAVFSQISLEV